jgi:hypothetical protein
MRRSQKLSACESERRLPEREGVQGTLGEAFDVVPDDVAPVQKTRIAAHEREPKNKNKNLFDGNDDAGLFFDESKVSASSSPLPMTRRQDWTRRTSR